MHKIPRDPALDGTLALLREGYEFIWNRCRRLRSDVFATRIMGKRAICIHGRDAAELFYDQGKFRRHGALPRRVVTSLFGKQAVHTLDDAAHRARKAAFLSLMTPTSMESLMVLSAEHWRAAIRRWENAERVALFEQVQQILAGAACAWAGVPLDPRNEARRAGDLSAMVDAFGGAGPRLWRGKLARARAERWIALWVTRLRRGSVHVPSDCALAVMSALRDERGQQLDARTAAVEVLNVIRPTVAVSWYIAFAALALHQHPEARARLAEQDGGAYADLFMQEVRRFYPFTPYLGAKVRRAFVWRGHAFSPGTLVLLDVYGNGHDPRIWREPERFWPERFRERRDDAYDFIPQGGGSYSAGHRCPGEWITMHSITLALHFLTRCMRYDVVPDQDLGFDLGRMPTRPRSGFVVRNVRATALLDVEAPRLPSQSAARDSAAAAGHGETGWLASRSERTADERRPHP